MRILLALLITLSALSIQTAYAQKAPFVRDTSKPYAYLQFDHVGKRRPIRTEESTDGLWLKFVNNSNVPMEVGSFDPGTNDAGIGLLDEVVPYSNPGVRTQSVNPPDGYSGEVHSSMIVQPGDAVLFCVPREHVSKQWYLRVRFTLVVGKESVQQPSSYVEFTEGMLR
jgi:hypothetical protein